MPDKEHWISLKSLYDSAGVPLPPNGSELFVSNEEAGSISYHHLPQPPAIQQAVITNTLARKETPPMHQPSQLFEGAEHSFIGDHALLFFPNEKKDGPPQEILAKDRPLELKNNLALTYGKIVALGGDFYGDPANPISFGRDDGDCEERFRRAFESLERNPPVDAYKKRSPKQGESEPLSILAIMQEESQKIFEYINEGKSAHEAYQKMDDELLKKYVEITGGKLLLGTLPIAPSGRFIELANNNYDHFGNDAVTAYRTGHQYALKEACAGFKEKDPARLVQAYAMNAFADHFLTDLFSSGHLRVPRQQMNSALFNQSVGGLDSKMMHDEDNRFGLVVRNRKNRQWRAYGDKYFFDTVNLENKSMVQQALQASVTEIWKAYQFGEKSIPEQYEALNWIPILSAFNNYNDKTNFPAMYIAVESTLEILGDSMWGLPFLEGETAIKRRTPLNDTNSRKWENMNTGIQNIFRWKALAPLANKLTESMNLAFLANINIGNYQPSNPSSFIEPPALDKSFAITREGENIPAPGAAAGSRVAYAYSYARRVSNAPSEESEAGPWIFSEKGTIGATLNVPPPKDTNFYRCIYRLCTDPNLENQIQRIGELDSSTNTFTDTYPINYPAYGDSA